MFKYFWILMLIIPVLTLLGYTIWAIKDFLQNYEGDIDKEALSDFIDEHENLITIWGVIIGAAIVILFFASATAFNESRAAG